MFQTLLEDNKLCIKFSELALCVSISQKSFIAPQCVCDAAIRKKLFWGWWVVKRDIRRSHKHQTGTPSPQLSPPPPPQMYLAAVSVKVAGERLHGKRSRASWVESCGRIFSTSVCPTETGCFFFCFFWSFSQRLFILKRRMHGASCDALPTESDN